MMYPRSRLSPRSHSRKGRHSAEDVADLLTQDTQSEHYTHVYRPRESLYCGPRSHMLDSGDEENVDPNSGSSSQYTSTPRARPSSVRHERQTEMNIVSMLQEQQHLLEKLMEGQKKMEEKHTELEKKLKEVSDAMAQSSNSNTTDTDKANRKIRIKRDLTRKVTTLYDSLEDGFRESEGSTSTFNAAIKRKLINEILVSVECKYSEEEIKAAVQRKYESVRRQWKLEESFGDDILEMSKKMSVSRKYRARRKRKFDSRALMVKPEEVEYWKGLLVDDMSEESDDPENGNNLIVHKFKWCSEEFSRFKGILDTRYSERIKNESVLVARKTRTEGYHSETLPRDDAPQWIVDKNWTPASSQ